MDILMIRFNRKQSIVKMKLLKFLNYSIIIVLLSASSCKRTNEPEIPTGDHSFYCYIDGELFVPKGNTNFTSPSDDGLFLLKNEDYFKAEVYDYRKYFIMFNISDWSVGTHTLSESDNYYNYNINQAMVKVNTTWYKSKANSGYVTFLEAGLNSNTKGTFEFTLYNENDDSDTIHITDGHFDD